MDPNPIYSSKSKKKLQRFRSINLNSNNVLLFLISISALIAASMLFYRSIFSPNTTSNDNNNNNNYKYKIIIDGGSTGTRIHVFRYSLVNYQVVYDFEIGRGLFSMRVNPGLSSYADDPDGAGESLNELLEFAEKHVKEEAWKETEIRLMATAGLRLLDLETQGRILDACRLKLKGSSFKFSDEWASVITGSDEGVYAWVVANHAFGSLGGDPMQTTGIIELGGASAQVTFFSNEPMPSEFARSVTFGNSTYNLYSHSFLHFGQNAASEGLRELLVAENSDFISESLQKEKKTDPCFPKGYLYETALQKLSPVSLYENKHESAIQSGGNFSECRSASLMLLQKGKEKCSYDHCYIGSTFMPKLNGKILATENFFHTSKFFGLGSKARLSDLIMAGQQFCGEEWSELKRKYHSLDDEDLLRYCFSSSYIVGNIPLDWALGAFILQSALDLEQQHGNNWFVTMMGDDSPKLFSFVAISIILVFMVWSILKWRKPQLKTIYDLEKGRYIVTRIVRSR
ncbi:hypothetical protein ACFE04_024812 [Oxalis oulophora]